MNPKWQKRYIDLVSAVVEHLRGIVLVLVMLVTLLGFLTGYKYYRYTQTEPQYCATCHIMDDAIKEWSRSKHSNVVCQHCHNLSMLEQNQLLVAYVVRGTQQGFSQTHGRVKPWKRCRSCHEDLLQQMDFELVNKTGHAIHVTLNAIDCSVCHRSKLHSFKTSQLICVSCHKDRGIHGFGGDTATYRDVCVQCHRFTSKKPSGVDRQKCDNCHKNIPTQGVMSDLKCHQCHQPHRMNKVTTDSCLRNCHSEIIERPHHSIHHSEQIHCVSCHKPHRWVADRKDCRRCHKGKLNEGFDN